MMPVYPAAPRAAPQSPRRATGPSLRLPARPAVCRLPAPGGEAIDAL